MPCAGLSGDSEQTGFLASLTLGSGVGTRQALRHNHTRQYLGVTEDRHCSYSKVVNDVRRQEDGGAAGLDMNPQGAHPAREEGV